MKNLKKLASLLLALVMVFSFCYTGISVFAEETEPTITITPNTMAIDEFQAVTITVTGGTGGLEANKTYNIRLTKTSAKVDDSGFGKSGPYKYPFADGTTYPTTTVKTDANGGFTKEVNLHSSKITEIGVYAYCIMDDWSTKAVANFEVTLGKAKVEMSTTEVALGSDETISVTATGGEGGLVGGTWYRTRLYKVTTPKASGFGVISSLDNSYKFSNGLAYVETYIQADSVGGFTKEFDMHTTYVTETGYYVYTLMDNDWNTVLSISFEVVIRPTISLSATSVELGKNRPLTLKVTGGKNGKGEITGLEANHLYKIRLAKSYNTPEQTGFNSSGLAGGYVGEIPVTTDENGGFEITLDTHVKGASAIGKYTYAIMDLNDNNQYWATKAVANFEIVEPTTPDATLTVSKTAVELGMPMPITITATSGDNGLEANTTYNVRLMKSYNTPEMGGMGITSGLNQEYLFANGYNTVGAGTVTTDENGAFTIEVSLHKDWVTETGYYTYAIQGGDNGFQTFAVANFEVVEMADHGHFTNTKTEFIIGKGNVALTYENLDLENFGTTDVKLYKWTEDWNYSSDKSKYIAYNQLKAASGTITYTTAQMESFGGEGTYIAVLGGEGWTKLAEIKFTYVPNPKGMTIDTLTVYRGQYVNINLYGAQKGDAVGVFAKGVPNYTILGGTYRALSDGQTVSSVPTSALTPGEYTVGLWTGNWDFNARINIVVEKMDNDITYDAIVDVKDIVRLKKMVAGIVDSNDDANLNADDKIDSLDITYLKKVILGLDLGEVITGDNEVADTWNF